MIVPDFAMFAAAYISNTHPTKFSALVGRELQDSVNIYVTDDRDNWSYQSFPRKETIATSEQLKQSNHNFDANLEQIDVEGVKRFSFFDPFDFYRNPKVGKNTLAYRYEPITSVYNSKNDILQSALSFYNTVNLNNSYMQKISSFFERKIALLVADKASQESMEIDEKEQEHTTEIGSLPLSQEELADAFTHKASSTSDAFTTEDSSSLRTPRE
ncbi:hypothetical protein [Bartonella tribocorum]|uniref:Uncharacterized protein n=1 Tax=Bartonella tribocorum TaxID=85701 RepID=A0A2M6USF5_9HYPH|nr:hypothetical protein [Bartonella tribocorum]PIT69112.1 hypothetical protein CER18_04700 [Bartonella tribocorum]